MFGCQGMGKVSEGCRNEEKGKEDRKEQEARKVEEGNGL